MDASTAPLTTVVVIEDDYELRNLLANVLEACGYQVFTAGSGHEGLALARLLKPQAITLDLGLPDMNGQDLLSALKSDPETEQIPVIVVSGSIDLLSPVDLQKAFCIVNKPFDLVELEAAAGSAVHPGEASCLSLF